MGANSTFFLYDGEQLLCELNSQGQVITTYAWGAAGLAERANSPSQFYAYTFDLAGNLVQRHRQTQQVGEDSYAASTTAYDVMGYLLLDTSINSGQPFLFTDPIGGQGQQGVYTDYETRPSACVASKREEDAENLKARFRPRR